MKDKRNRTIFDLPNKIKTDSQFDIATNTILPNIVL